MNVLPNVNREGVIKWVSSYVPGSKNNLVQFNKATMTHPDCGAVSFQNCIIVSVAFFLIFSGYSGAQRFATSAGEDAQERDISVAIIYTTFPFAALFVGPLVKRISARKVFIGATSCYALYVAANIKVIPFILYLSAALEGLAAPCLWVARNVFITDCANQNEILHHEAPNSKLGSFNGIFFSIFQFSAILGSVIGGLVFEFDGSDVYLYAFFTFICVVGVLTFLCIKPMNLHQTQAAEPLSSASNFTEIQLINRGSLNEDDGDDNEPIIEDTTAEETADDQDRPLHAYNMMQNTNVSIQSELVHSGMRLIGLFKQFNLWCILPLFVYSGLEIGFDSADFPLLITNNVAKFYILGYYGLVSVVSSYYLGKLSDNIHRSYIMLILFVIHQVAWIALYFTKDVIFESQNNIVFVLLATIFGVGVGIIATQKFAIIPILVNNEPEAYQCVFLIESPCAALVFYLHSYLDFSTKVIINSITLCVAVIPFLFFPTIRDAFKPKKSNRTDTDNMTRIKF
eukprot:175982_1